MIRQNELMNVRCSERGSLLGIKIYSPSSECLIECVDIPEHRPRIHFFPAQCARPPRQAAHQTLGFLWFLECPDFI